MQVHFCRTMNPNKSTYFFVVLSAFLLILNTPPAVGASVKIKDDLSIDLSSYGTRLFRVPDEHTGYKLQRLHLWRKVGTKGEPNPEELGSYVEGDLLVPRKPLPLSTRNGMMVESYLWQNGVIPYEIAGSFDENAKENIERVISTFNRKTCLKFVPYKPGDSDYISIQSSNTGCWSSVGRIGGKQPVNLQTPGCTWSMGTIAHEFMHAIGFLHEQNREERDEYVDIRMNKVQKGFELNFEKAAPDSKTDFGVGYDYNSIMHFSNYAFSSDGAPTIVTKPEGLSIGQRESFSKLDIKKILHMYGCGKMLDNENKSPTSGSENNTSTSTSGSGNTGEILSPFVNNNGGNWQPDLQENNGSMPDIENNTSMPVGRSPNTGEILSPFIPINNNSINCGSWLPYPPGNNSVKNTSTSTNGSDNTGETLSPFIDTDNNDNNNENRSPFMPTANNSNPPDSENNTSTSNSNPGNTSETLSPFNDTHNNSANRNPFMPTDNNGNMPYSENRPPMSSGSGNTGETWSPLMPSNNNGNIGGNWIPFIPSNNKVNNGGNWKPSG